MFYKLVLFGVFCIFCFVFFGTPVFAKYTAGDAQNFLNDANQGAGVEQTDVYTISARIVKVGLTVVGLVFFILIFYAGFKWLTARGEEESIKKAQSTIIASIIGLMIVVGSYAATNFVVNRLIGGEPAEQPKIDKDSDKKPTGPLGCCLDEFEAAGGFWDWGNAHHWLWSKTDKAICEEQGLTCGEGDQLCGSENWAFLEGVTDPKECEEAKNLKETT